VVSAVDQNSGAVVRFCTKLPPVQRKDPTFRKVDLTVDHILASAGVPLLFPPGEKAEGMDGDSFVDAGLVANTPLAPAMRYEPDRVIVVSGAGVTRPAKTPDSLGGAISLLVDNVARFALHADVDHARTVNQMVRAAPAATAKREIPILVIEPDDLGFSVDGFLRFKPDKAKAMIEYGREQGEKALAGWNH
jgi:NTE family protein